MLIEREAYHDPRIFQCELETVFAERLFAGIQHDFAQQDAFRSLLIGARAVTVRRTDGGVRAFGNVCLHRNALIDPPGHGTRPFRCRYHGWGYDAQGELASAPLTEYSCIDNTRLPAYPVTEAGGLLFLGLGGFPPPVHEVGDLLARTDIEVSAPFHRGSMEHACNWKLLVENVLEGYHLSFVHAETFRPAGFPSTSGYRWEGAGYTSCNWLEPADASGKAASIQRLAPGAGHYYRHGYVFPDLFLSNTNGLVGFLSHVMPLDAARTRLDWMLFELPALASLPQALRQHMQSEAIAFTEKALREDQVLVEACQLGLSSLGSYVQLQPSEARIEHFHQLYSGRMKHAQR